MTKHKKITQIMLIMLGIFLILATYVYGPLSQKRKLSEANLKMQEQLLEEELNFEKKVEMFVENLEIDRNSGQLLANKGFSSIEEIYRSSIDEIKKIEGVDEKFAEELMEKSKDYISNKFVENLEIDRNLGQLLANKGFSSIEEIYQSSIDELKKIEGVDEKFADELIEKSKDYISNKKENVGKKIDSEKKNILEDEIINLVEGEDANIFENVEYNGIYNINNTFILKSDKAKIFSASPNFVVMKKMHVTLFMNDGRVVIITSDSGTYNKVTHDSFFEKNVEATDGETIILGDKLDLVSTEKWAQIYNNVIVKDQTKSFLKADKILYDFTSELYQVSMLDNKKVKVKIIK